MASNWAAAGIGLAVGLLIVAGILSDKRFGRPLTVDLCDEYVDSHKEILIE